jgi:hypothetical protein
MTAKAIALRGLEKNEEALAFNPITLSGTIRQLHSAISEGIKKQMIASK